MAVTRKYRGRRKSTSKNISTRAWLGAIFLVLVLAILFRWLVLTPYEVKTSFLGKTLYKGDLILFNKWAYGPRTPVTLLRLPFLHQRIPGLGLPAYVDDPDLRLPLTRLQTGAVKRQDLLVFNQPTDQAHPIDLRAIRVLRCVAVAGDTLSIKRSRVYINGQLQGTPEGRLYDYQVQAYRQISPLFLREHRLGVKNLSREAGLYVYELSITLGQVEALQTLKRVGLVKRIRRRLHEPEKRYPTIFPRHPNFKWNRDHFGPILIPAKGMQIPMTKNNVILYGDLIRRYEIYPRPESVVIRDQQLFINGKPVAFYTFQQDYYFVLGDHFHRARDSRHWGLLPEDHIMGKAWLAYASADPQAILGWKWIR